MRVGLHGWSLALRRLRAPVRVARNLGLAALGLLLAVQAMAWLVRPALDLTALPQYAAAERERVREQREMTLDADSPPVVVKHVDYSEGPAARWYPRGESPIFAELVAEGVLPPVAERVGPEPIVVEGPEGVGRYGGTWISAEGDRVSAETAMFTWFGYQTLVRWSPQGYPLVPHLATSWEVSPDHRVYTFHLRRGVKWSDGQPFSADDIMYYWDAEQKNKLLTQVPVPNMMIGGRSGEIEKIDNHTVRFVFPEPYGLFLESLAGPWGLMNPASSPAHYLRQYHPELGDAELCEREMKARGIATRVALYYAMKAYDNPEHPRLAPWVLRTYRSNPPLTFVRNPYYFMVDVEGNQLPYIDRYFYQVKSPDMISIAAGNGDLTMQGSQLNYSDYTYLMSQRERGGFEVRHWYQADRSNWFVCANLNLRIDPDRPETQQQHRLLNDKRFRQALSLATNREQIIQAEFNGQTTPAQIAPGPDSFFYDPESYARYTEHDPDRANALLDAIGLTNRDAEGFRTYPDGSRMTFFLPVVHDNSSLLGPAQFVAEDWAKVGVRTLLREKSGALLLEEMFARTYTLFVAPISQVEHIPVLEPRLYLPLNMASVQALGYARWYMAGGLYGDERAQGPGCVPIPPDHPFQTAVGLFEKVMRSGDPAQQRDLFRGVQRIAAENLWAINISTPPPKLFVVKNGLRNVPKTAVTTWMFMSPGNTGFETFYFDDASDTPGTVAQIKEEVRRVVPSPRSASGRSLASGGNAAGSASGGDTSPSAVQPASAVVARLFQVLFVGIGLAAAVMAGLRHPYIGRRLLQLVPMLAVVSVVMFAVIQLPPGDYASTYIMRLQEEGTQASEQAIRELEEQFFLNEPLAVRYVRWLGLNWFLSFDEKDAGLLQGNMGRSMETRQRVNDMVGDRLLLTFLISLGTILLTWALAVPIGIYSAVRQHSAGDYVLTFLGFIGMCIPSFLFALLLLYASKELFDIRISGLFSAEYAAQSEWTWGKVRDLLAHVWVPVVVLGVGGTGGMIRVMRANLLDELRKPYVVTARAKGMRPVRLLLKYPVRLALNPFISGIGGILPMLVSGGAIVDIVLSLPTVGPLMLSALLSEDMYLAGSMLMLLSLLGMFGTLVSDLLLLWLDPRIRYEAGSR